MSPEAMTEDPEFFAAPNVPATSNVLDLSARATLWGCISADLVAKRTPGPCASVFCGDKATCYEDAGLAKCQCASGEVIQTYTGPDGTPSFTCVPAKNPYGVTPETVVSKDGTSDPCKAFACGGEATCVLRGGFPTCSCKNGSGFWKTSPLAGTSPVTCGPVSANAVARGAGGGSESVIPTQLFSLLEVERPWDGRVGMAATSLLVMLLLAGMGRRRREV